MAQLHSRWVLTTLFICAWLTILGFFFISASWTRLDTSTPTKQTSHFQAQEKSTQDRKVTVVGWQPRAFLYHGFLARHECDYIIRLAGGDIVRSEVVDQNGQKIVDAARTSYGTFISRHMKDPLIVDIEDRISRWVFLPKTHAEDFYLLRYELGQEYKAHTDWFAPWDESSRVLGTAGNRLVTVIMYLSDVEEGGETWFPNAKLKVRPSKGDALMFWNQTPDHQLDIQAAHSSLPVIRGTKWSLTRWIRERSLS